MTEALYLKDSYVKEFEATVTDVNGKYIVLDKTYFYPNSGGQPHDVGTMDNSTEKFNVIFVKKIDHDISHELDKEGLKKGDKVKCKIDWQRRYTLMRYHTATHVVAKVFSEKAGVLITGNQLDIDKARVDFDLENFDRSIMEDCINKANEIIQKDFPVSHYFMKKEDAVKDESLFKLATRDFIETLPHNIRILEIKDLDRQVDGGTHVHSLREIGKIELLKCENKGKFRRRVYFKIVD